MNIATQGGASQEAVKEFEQTYHLHLPEDYREFLEKYNGGYVPKTSFEIGEFSSCLCSFFGLKGAKRPLEKLNDLTDFLEAGFLPVADDDWDEYVVMDVKNQPGQMYITELTDRGFELSFLTDTFKEFIQQCESEPVDFASYTRSIPEREAELTAEGRGHLLADPRSKDQLLWSWKAQIDHYKDTVLEEVVLS